MREKKNQFKVGDLVRFFDVYSGKEDINSLGIVIDCFINKHTYSETNFGPSCSVRWLKTGELKNITMSHAEILLVRAE